MPEDKNYTAQLGYLNNFCLDVVKARRQESPEQLAKRKDLLSRIMVTTHVRRNAFWIQDDLVRVL